MVAYSFNKQFVPLILDGSKNQTIRRDRKRHAYPTEFIQLYAGMRTKHCRAIGLATCHEVMKVELFWRERRVRIQSGRQNNQIELRHSAFDLFAQADGFRSAEGMASFWEEHHGKSGVYPFEGVLILWRDFNPATSTGRLPSSVRSTAA